MLNSLATGRLLALRMVAAQIGAAAVLGLVFLLQGPAQGLAAALGALVVAMGTALFAMRAFASLGGGTLAFGRLLSGMMLKWMVTLGGLFIILVQYKLPPIAAITGLTVAYSINLLAFRFKG